MLLVIIRSLRSFYTNSASHGLPYGTGLVLHMRVLRVLYVRVLRVLYTRVRARVLCVLCMLCMLCMRVRVRMRMLCVLCVLYMRMRVLGVRVRVLYVRRSFVLNWWTRA